MGQGNKIKLPTRVSNPELSPDDGSQMIHREKLIDRQSPDRDDQFRLEDGQFSLEPVGAITHFSSRGNPVAAGRFLTGKASAYRRHIQMRAHLRLR